MTQTDYKKKAETLVAYWIKKNFLHLKDGGGSQGVDKVARVALINDISDAFAGIHEAKRAKTTRKTDRVRTE